MIRKQSEYPARSNPPATILHTSAPSSQNQNRPLPNRPEPTAVFDAARIIERYRSMREHQHRSLAQINLSQDLKQQLFGFKERRQLTNSAKVQDLVIQHHQLKGRIIMTKQQYQTFQIQKHREKQLEGSQRSAPSPSSTLSPQRRHQVELPSTPPQSINQPEHSQESLVMHPRSQQQ